MKAIIATEHSINMGRDKGKSLALPMQGGDPYFVYVWINDVLYSLRTKGGKRGFTLARVRN